VWRALTGPEGIAALYFGSHLEAPFAEGKPYRYLGPGPGGDVISQVEGEVLALKPNALLQLAHRAGPAWRKAGQLHTSRLAYALEDVRFATRLTLTHDRWEEGDPGYEHNRTGWPIFLSSVKSYVETGRALDLAMAG
jgi:uncharacterized protein YndB with AHSA1/START domain